MYAVSNSLKGIARDGKTVIEIHEILGRGGNTAPTSSIIRDFTHTGLEVVAKGNVIINALVAMLGMRYQNEQYTHVVMQHAYAEDLMIVTVADPMIQGSMQQVRDGGADLLIIQYPRADYAIYNQRVLSKLMIMDRQPSLTTAQRLAELIKA